MSYRLSAMFPISAAMIVVASSLQSSAAPPAQSVTVVTVSEMCGGCVKKINARLDDYPGIAAVQCNIKTKTVTIVPESNTELSPRGIWEALDDIGKTPIKLAGPGGTFTAKPKS